MHQAPINDLYVLDSVQHDALAAARAERLTRALGATAKVVSREELDEAARQWPWRGAQFYPRRTGSFDYAPGWTIVLDTYAAPGRDGGVTPAGFRNAAKLAEVGGVCRSALEIHCASGCFHRCAYCHCHPDFHIACDLETMLELLPGYFAEHADQLLWKFDNGTDTLVLEPEYGASELMVPFFAAADRFLMLYTKSDNVDHLLDLPHNGQTIINWSLAGRTQSAELELGAPDSFARIKAMRLFPDFSCVDAERGIFKATYSAQDDVQARNAVLEFVDAHDVGCGWVLKLLQMFPELQTLQIEIPIKDKAPLRAEITRSGLFATSNMGHRYEDRYQRYDDAKTKIMMEHFRGHLTEREMREKQAPIEREKQQFLDDLWEECQPYLKIEAATYEVVRIIDGDTLIVRDESGHTERVRLRRLNAPESSEPGGPEAKAELAKEFPVGTQVELTIYARDKYGCNIANVEAD